MIRYNRLDRSSDGRCLGVYGDQQVPGGKDHTHAPSGTDSLSAAVTRGSDRDVRLKRSF